MIALTADWLSASLYWLSASLYLVQPWGAWYSRCG